jgi:hypothetical protein
MHFKARKTCRCIVSLTYKPLLWTIWTIDALRSLPRIEPALSSSKECYNINRDILALSKKDEIFLPPFSKMNALNVA